MPASPMPTPAAPEAPSRPLAEPIRLSWAAPSGMIGLSAANFLLKLVTLGFYQFWGKTEVRRRIWSGIRLNGEPLQYTGTGRELLVGFLIVFAAVLLPMLLVFVGAAFAFGPSSPALQALQGLSYLVFLFLYGFAIHRAQRYRLSRTHWRGIRGGVDGSAAGYAWTYFWTGLLIPLTLGWIVPWRANTLQCRLTEDTRFGNRYLEFVGGAGPLYARFWFVWLATLALGLFGLIALGAYLGSTSNRPIPTIRRLSATDYIVVASILLLVWLLYSVVTAWYRARVINHFAASTRIEGLRFTGSAKGRSLMWLGITNFLVVLAGGLVVVALVGLAGAGIVAALPDPGGGLDGKGAALSLLLQAAPLLFLLGFGILTPVTQTRSARYIVERLAIDGTLDTARIAQRADTGSQYGEGAAQAFDLDAF